MYTCKFTSDSQDMELNASGTEKISVDGTLNVPRHRRKFHKENVVDGYPNTKAQARHSVEIRKKTRCFPRFSPNDNLPSSAVPAG